MNKHLEEVLDRLEKTAFRMNVKELPEIAVPVRSLRAYFKTLEEFTISSITEQRGEEFEKVLDEYQEVLSQNLAEEFAEFLSAPNRDPS